MKLLNLGCGNSFHKDWINIDFISNNKYVISHNLLEGIPYENFSIDVVYHSHVLEHFSKNDGENFIKDCHRVLKRGGIIRVAVPDLESIAKEYLHNLTLVLEGDKDAINNYNWIKLELLDQMARNKSGGEMAEYLYQPNIANEQYVYKRIGLEGKNIRNDYLQSQKEINSSSIKPPYKASRKKIIKNSIKSLLNKSLLKLKLREPIPRPEVLKIGNFRLCGEIHQWMYDRYSLTELLKLVGFADIQVCTAYESRIKNWKSYNLDVINEEVRKPDSLFIEGRKL